MASRTVRKTIERFLGLSDRSVPAELSAYECPDLLNVDFSERHPKRRAGYSRQHANVMRIGSSRFDGVNDYVRIPHVSTQVIAAGSHPYVAVVVMLTGLPNADMTIVSKGYGARTAATNGFRLEYRPAQGTGSLGCWEVNVYDTGAATARTYQIDDPATAVAGSIRFLEFTGEAGGATARFKMWKSDGTTSTASTTTQPGGYVASTDDLTVGVSWSAASVLGTDFAKASIAELRWKVATAAGMPAILTAVSPTSTNLFYKSELTPTAIASLSGYWKMNDGSAGGFLDDAAGTNDAIVPGNPADWILDQSLVIGKSALRFNGGQGFIRLDYATTIAPNTLTPSTIFALNTAAGAINNRWTVRGVFTPYLGPNETTCRDQTILWAGGDSAIPSPIAVRIRSDQFEFLYRDGANTRTVTIASPVASSLVGTKVRWACWRAISGTGVATFFGGICYLSGGVQTIAQGSQACNAANGVAGSVSSHWAFGRHLQAASATADFTLPYASYSAAGDGSAYGILDSVQLIWHSNGGNGAANPAVAFGALNSTQMGPFTEFSNWSVYCSTAVTVVDMKLNEGSGSILVANDPAATVRYTAKSLPEPDDGIHPDIGLVDPYQSDECQGLFQFNRFLQNGTRKTSLIAVNGCTGYEIDTSAGTATAVFGGLYRGPSGSKWTGTVYGNKLYLAGPNGKRPVSWDGSALKQVGIDAPLSPLVATTANSTGTWPAGTYYLYVTYRNKETGDESNPSPGVAVVMGGGGGEDTITALQLPTSPDPQVNQRRVYVTLVGGGDGSTAYGLLDIDDNTTTSYTDPILATVTTGVSLSYLDNDVPPATAIVTAFRDTVFAAGNQAFPTRVWRSGVGTPTAWNQSSDYIDLDLDQGNAVTALLSLNTFVAAHLRNGYALVFNTGDDNAPIGFTFANRDHGAIGPQCVAKNNSRHIFVTARDIFESDGSSDRNLSSPLQPDLPSIQTTLQTGLNPGRMASASAANYRTKKAYWIAASSTSATRNDVVYVLDYSQGVTNRNYFSEPSGLWTKYDLPIDAITEFEDHTEAANLYGAIQGFVCKLDTGTYDAATTNVSGNVVSGTSTTLTAVFAAASISRGMRVWVYHASGNTCESNTVQSVNDGTGVITFYDSFAATPTSSDSYFVGTVPFYMDFILRVGQPMRRKRMKWVRIYGDSDNNSNRVRLSYKANNVGRTFVYTSVTESVTTWLSTEQRKLIGVGGLFDALRIRLSECGLSSASSSNPVPMPTGTLKPYSIEWEYDEIGGN